MLSIIIAAIAVGAIYSSPRRRPPACKAYGSESSASRRQNRYKSILCQEDSCLLELVRYIHLNPLRAKLISDYNGLGRHPYCGHGVILGRRKKDWQDTEYILGLFGDKEAGARRKYSEFIGRGIKI